MKILAVFAHPDDETMLTGGILAMLARQGVEAHYLCATRGEGGELGDPPVCERDQAGMVRAGEMACAVQALGGASLTFLDYVDPLVGPGDSLFAFTEDLPGLTLHIAEAVRQLDAGAVITHGVDGEYGHPAHVLVHAAARRAVESFGAQAPALYSVQADFSENPKPRLANPSTPAHLIVDVTAALPQKQQAALCHRSQHALFVRRASEEAGRSLSVAEVITSLESLHRVLPAVPAGAPLRQALDDPLALALFELGARPAEG